MRLTKQQQLSIVVILFCIIIMLLINNLGLGKYLSVVLPCATNPQDSMYCYSGYDMFAYVVLGFVVLVCLAGLIIDFIRNMTHKR